jgi:hypothetical protein
MLNLKEIAALSLNNKNINNILKQKYYSNEKKIPENKEKKPIIKKKEDGGDFFAVDKNCDSLIWYYHILNNGQQSYHFLGSNAYQEENKIKMELVYKIRDKKQILKNHKIKYRNVEDNLCNGPKININTFLALLIINETNFYYSDEKFYYEKLINTDLDKYCYIKKKEGKYYLWINDKKPENGVFKKLIIIDNLDKPLKSITNYKKTELEEICDKLKIKYQYVGQKKFTKNKLYGLIQENIL